MDYLSTYQQYLTTIGLQESTIKSKIKHLSYYLEYLKEVAVLEVTPHQIKQYYQHILQHKTHCRVVTQKYYMITLKQFYSWLLELRYMDYHPFGNLKLPCDDAHPKRVPIAESKIKVLYKSVEVPAEKLLLIFGYGCGLRAKEMLDLQAVDIKFDKGLLIVKHGKNNKRRAIPLQPNHQQYLRSYILQNGLSKYHHFFEVTHSTLLHYFKELQQRLGWLPPFFSLHHLRHSIASHLVDRGLELDLVQQFLGHSSLKTTEHYVSPIKEVELW